MLSWITSFFAKRSFRGKIMLTLSSVCIVIIVALDVGSYKLAANELLRMSTKLSENNIQSAERQLSEFLDTAQENLTQVIRIKAFQNLRKKDLTAEEIRRRGTLAAVAVSRCVNSAAEKGVAFRTIEFFSKSGFMYRYPSTYATDFSSYDDCIEGLGIDGEDRYIRPSWILYPVKNQQNKRVDDSLICVRFLYDSLMKKQGVLIAALDGAALAKTYRSYADGSFIVNREGRLISSPELASVGTEYKNGELLKLIFAHSGSLSSFSFRDNAGRNVIYSCSPVMDQSATLVIPFNYYTGISKQEAFKFSASMVLLSLLMIAVSLLLSSVISTGLTNSLRSVTRTVKRVYNGETALRCTVSGHDEVAYLGAKINDMLDSIVSSMKKREQDLEAKRLLEVKLMQSQINPHLLYNTLDAVLWHLQSDRANNAADLIEALSGFFKYALSKGSARVTLKEEIQLIRYYLSIQHLARQQDITLTLDIPQELLSVSVIQLSIQPVIENAVIHGFSGYRNDGQIHIHAACDDRFMRITMRDNGIGISPEELEGLTDALAHYPPPEHMKYFGLYNINWRIKNTYGGKYGITVDSAISEYTTVCEWLPLPAPPCAQEAEHKPDTAPEQDRVCAPCGPAPDEPSAPR